MSQEEVLDAVIIDKSAGAFYDTTKLPQREDEGLEAKDGWKWRPVGIMKDDAAAANQPAKQLWGDECDVWMCLAHISGEQMWMSRHRYLLEDEEKHFEEIKGDVDVVAHDLPFAEIAEDVKQLMFHKWREMGEEAFTDAFVKAWGGKKWTLAEINAKSPILAGLPATNNPLERQNGIQKADMERAVVGTTALLPNLAQWLFHESIRDEAFAPKLRWDQSNRAFCERAEALLDVNGELPTMLMARKGADGWLLVPSAIHAEQVVKALREEKVDPTPARVAERLGARDSGDVSWRTTFSRLLRDPKAFMVTQAEKEGEEWGFDAIMDWATTFYAMARMRDGTLADDLTQRVRASGFVVDDAALETCGWHTCMCRQYRAYAWCKHVLAKARQDGVVTKLPTLRLDERPGMNSDLPSLIESGRPGRERGRNRMSRAGEMLVQEL